MINLTKCPICNNILLNMFVQKLFDNSSEILHKVCNCSLSHNIRIIFNNTGENINFLHVLYKSDGFLWLYKEKKIEFGKANYNKHIFRYDGYLPWVEPDLEDLRKTINKLQKYILFS